MKMLSNLCRTTTRTFKIFSQIRNLTTYDSTIFAKSSGQGKCGVSVIRVSGPESELAINSLTKTTSIPKKYERKALLKKLFDPENGEALDNALVLWFKGPRSFTGEDSCEFHIHGGPAVVSAVLTALSKIQGLRHAKAGEFTRRAFHNDKLGLTEIEALADLIHSETEAQRKQAIRGMDGALAQLFSGWRKRLIKCTANTEAWIDFSEDEHIESDTMDLVFKELEDIYNSVDKHLKDHRKGERLRSGVHAVIVGKPNVGKSSLLNIICQRPVSIVSPIAGTTRDVIETAYDIGGYPVIFSDTAGLRFDTEDVVEKEGVRRAEARLNEADLAIVMLDVAELSKSPDTSHLNIIEDQLKDMNIPQWIDDVLLNAKEPPIGSDLILVANKCDLAYNMDSLKAKLPNKISLISCKNEEGFDNFVEKLKKSVEVLCGNPLVETGCLMRERHVIHLKKCQQAIAEFMDVYDHDIVIAAARIRVALNEIGRITGEVRPEDILDVIFKDFCIGK